MKTLMPASFLLLIVAMFFATEKIHSQATDFTSIKHQFDNYRENVLQEKMYVHTDKNFYLAGELLWFKLYNVDASLHQPLDISKVAYVEILDKDHNAVLQTKLSIKDGIGNGSLYIPQNLASGNYIFRAYTNWMKNFDPDFYFEKIITLINTIDAKAVDAVANTGISYDVQFFPEGGNLVNGIESVIGCRVVDQYGTGKDFTGIILDQENDTVTKFQSLKFGIGSFNFQPEDNKIYRAVVNIDGANFLTKELPKAYEQGYVLHLAKLENGNIQVKIKASNNFRGRDVYLFVHCRQQVVEARNFSTVNNEIVFEIDEKKLVDGISQFTVFNSQKQPVCERLFFKRPTQQLVIEAKADQQQYESRKKVNIQINTKDEAGQQQSANMSMAVFKFDSSFDFSRQNIQTYLLLSSDLKGNIESPEYYFNNTGAETEQAVDNLMLTQGWRRFNWQAILQNKTYGFSFMPEYEGHIVSGIVSNKLSGQPVKNIQSFLAIPDSAFQFFTGITDSAGKVNFYTKNFYGSHEIFGQAGGKERNFRIDLKSPFSETYSSRLLQPFSLSSVSGFGLQAGSISTQVQNIYAKESIDKFSPLTIDTSSFFVPTRTYILDNYVRFPTMEEVLREYVQEVAVIKQNNSLRLETGRRDAAGIVYRYEPLVLVDGVPLFDDPDKIFGYDPLKVKELQVVNKKYFLGASSFEGILNFKTYTGRPEGLTLDPNATVIDYEGLQLQREFFSPVYETQNQVTSRLPDFRHLLYWVPIIKTNPSGKQQVSFYTSDLAGKYMVTIEGLSVKGSAGYQYLAVDVINPLFVQKQ
jgi:hypothetical protein